MGKRKYIKIDGKECSSSEIKKARPKIVYWVILDKGVEKKINNCIGTFNMFVARNIKHADKLARKYNAERIERLIECKLGRWIVGEKIIKGEEINNGK